MKCSVFFSVLDPFSAISVWICWVPSALSLNLSLFCSWSAKCESQCFFFFLGVNLNLNVFARSLLCLNLTVLGSFSGESEFQHCVFLCTEFGTYLMSQSASTLGLVPIHHRRDWKEVCLTVAVVQEPQLKASYWGLCTAVQLVALLIGYVHQRVLFHFLAQVVMMYFSLPECFIYFLF